MSNTFSKKYKIVCGIILLIFIAGIIISANSDDSSFFTLLVVGLILFTLFIIAQIFISRRQKSESNKEKNHQGDPDSNVQQTSKPENYEKLGQIVNQNIDEVVSFIAEFKHVSQGEAIYSVPWYLVIGPEGSGKSSLLLSSGLNFSRLASQRQLELNLLKQTSLSDWRLTEDALYLDTPGEMVKESFNKNWEEYLKPLIQRRNDRPLDGIVVVISCHQILNADSLITVENFGKSLRLVINKIMALIKKTVPVYLVISQID